MQIAACGHPAPPPEKPAQKPVTAVADLAGSWTASDELDFGYALTIGADGSYDQWIDRNKLGRCEQKGTLAGSGTALQVTYKVNDCHRELAGTTQTLTIEAYDGATLTIATRDERHVYHHSAPPAGGAARAGEAGPFDHRSQ